MTNIEIVRVDESKKRFIDVVGKVTLKVYFSGEITVHPYVHASDQVVISLDDLLDWVEDKEVFLENIFNLIKENK